MATIGVLAISDNGVGIVDMVSGSSGAQAQQGGVSLSAGGDADSEQLYFVDNGVAGVTVCVPSGEGLIFGDEACFGDCVSVSRLWGGAGGVVEHADCASNRGRAGEFSNWPRQGDFSWSSSLGA